MLIKASYGGSCSEKNETERAQAFKQQLSFE